MSGAFAFARPKKIFLQIRKTVTEQLMVDHCSAVRESAIDKPPKLSFHI